MQPDNSKNFGHTASLAPAQLSDATAAQVSLNKPVRHRFAPRSRAVDRAALIAFAFLFACVFLRPQAASGWQTASEAIQITIADPLKKYQSSNSFRPLTVTIATASGKPAERTQTYWLVQRLVAPYRSYALDRKKYKKFTLPAGQQQVTVKFIAELSSVDYSQEQLFIEQDGDLQANFGVFSGNKDFWIGSRDLDVRPELTAINILHCRSQSGHLNTNTSSFLIDFTAAPGMPQRQVEIPLPPLSPEQAAPPLALIGAREISEELLNSLGNRYAGTTPAPPVKYTSSSQFIEESSWFAACTPAQMPDSWIALINVELLLINQQDLNGLSSLQREAISKWVAAGGRLAVTDCSEAGGGISRIPEQLLDSGLKAGQQVRPPQWYSLPQSEPVPPLEFQQFALPVGEDCSAATAVSGNSFKAEAVTGSPAGDSEDCFFYDHVLGRVVATHRQLAQFQTDDWRRLIVVAWGKGRTNRVFSSIGTFTLDGERFPRFVLEGVGEPPRLLFLCLITLFALTVGPIAYTVLYRSRRTNYLLFVVPVVSALTTLGLLLYAILADGFQFRSLRLSYSRLDQNAQQAVTLTRHSVFSATNPQFYSVDRDELLLPTAPEGRNLQQFEDLGGKGRFVASWLRARTPHQMAVAKVRSASERLQISRQEVDGQDELVVSNQLGTPLLGALLRFEDNWYGIGELAAGASGKAKRTEPESFFNSVRPHLAPAALIEEQRRTASAWGEGINGDSGLTELMTRPELFGPKFIGPGQYIAILGDYLGAGHLKENAQYQKQLHMIHGNW